MIVDMQEKMPTFSQAEDISFSMTLQMNAGIRSVVPHQPADDESLVGSILDLHIGDDEHATYAQKCSGMLRWAVNKYWIERGFVPMAWRVRGGLEAPLTPLTAVILSKLTEEGFLDGCRPSEGQLLGQFVSPKDVQPTVFLKT
jgi:hypothetical protein